MIYDLGKTYKIEMAGKEDRNEYFLIFKMLHVANYKT